MIYFITSHHGEASSITDEEGFLLTQQCWGHLKSDVDDYFRKTTDAEITAYNGERNERLYPPIYEDDSCVRKRHEPVFSIPDRFVTLKNFARLRGWVYCIAADGKNGYKIGQTGKNLRSRVRRNAYELEMPVTLIDAVRTQFPLSLEGYLHRHFREKRISGEWFDLSSQDIADIPVVAYHFHLAQDQEIAQ